MFDWKLQRLSVGNNYMFVIAVSRRRVRRSLAPRSDVFREQLVWVGLVQWFRWAEIIVSVAVLMGCFLAFRFGVVVFKNIIENVILLVEGICCS